MEVNKLINLSELARRSDIKHSKIWQAIKYGKPTVINDIDRNEVIKSIDTVSKETSEAYQELKNFFK
jgi:ribosomal protein S8